MLIGWEHSDPRAHSRDDDMTELMRNDLDSHDWAARAAEALARAKSAARIEAIRSHQKGSTTSHCRRHEELVDAEKSQRRDASRSSAGR
jgi:hypothetical protein